MIHKVSPGNNKAAIGNIEIIQIQADELTSPGKKK
jgi:hypothetical protein